MGRTAASLCLASVFLVACRSQPLAIERPVLETPGGVLVRDLLRGEGAGAAPGERIAIDYVAWLGDGTRVDSTRERGRPVIVVLGRAPLGGWNEGLLGLALGGRRRMLLPPESAYGSEGVPGLVPPGATLVFEVERVPLDPLFEQGEADAPPGEGSALAEAERD